jgi:hypothetical protein
VGSTTSDYSNTFTRIRDAVAALRQGLFGAFFSFPGT